MKKTTVRHFPTVEDAKNFLTGEFSREADPRRPEEVFEDREGVDLLPMSEIVTKFFNRLGEKQKRILSMAASQLLLAWSKNRVAEEIKKSRMELVEFTEQATPQYCFKILVKLAKSKATINTDIVYYRRIFWAIINYQWKLPEEKCFSFNFWKHINKLSEGRCSPQVWLGMFQRDPEKAYREIPKIITTERAAHTLGRNIILANERRRGATAIVRKKLRKLFPRIADKI